MLRWEKKNFYIEKERVCVWFVVLEKVVFIIFCCILLSVKINM